MEEMKLGPNGSLVFCMNYFWENIDWFFEQMEGVLEHDYILFDCPG